MVNKAQPKKTPKAKTKVKAKAAPKKTEKHAGGRPSAYKPEYVKQAYNYSLLGATDVQMAGYFGVTEKTLNNWKHDHPEFLQSLRDGKDNADAEIASSLFHRAKGYSHVDTKFATHEGVVTDAKEYTKHLPPDTTAAIFWLKNRQRQNWRDRQNVEMTGKDGEDLIPDDSPQEVGRKLAFILAQAMNAQSKPQTKTGDKSDEE